jgi:hypothetical protein
MDHVIEPLFPNNIGSDVIDQLCNLDRKAFGIDAWNESNFLSLFPGKSDLSFITKRNKQITGFIIGSTYNTPEVKRAHVNRIVAKGSGRLLMEAFEKAARAMDCKVSTLEFHKDLAVAGFYERCGYAALNEPEYIMKYVTYKGKENIADEYLSLRRRIYTKNL